MASEVSSGSYNMVNISIGAAPVITVLMNAVVLFWLIKEKRELPPEDPDEEEDDDWEKNWVNEDYDDDLTENNQEEFWDACSREYDETHKISDNLKLKKLKRLKSRLAHST